jgi:broad specificity phosphatase PhoE
MSDKPKAKKRTVRVTIKRHEKNKEDELTQEGLKDALKYGVDYIKVGKGQYALKVKGKIYIYHSPKNRARQTAQQLYRGIMMGEEKGIETAYSPLEKELLDAQDIPKAYRKRLAPLTTKERWKKEGLLYVVKNDPGKEGGESNDNVAARVAKYILEMEEKYMEGTEDGSETQVIGICHGPMLEHFLLNAYLDNYRSLSPEKAVRKIGGGFGNGETFEVVITEENGKRTYEIKRQGMAARQVSREKLEQIVGHYRQSHGHGEGVPSLGYARAA